MGGGFLYFWLLFAFFIFTAGMVALLVTIFYVGEWWEKKLKEKRLRPPEERLDDAGDGLK